MATIMVVDDETLTAQAVGFALSEHGHDVEIAANGSEGLAAL